MSLSILRWLPSFRDLDYEQQSTVTDCAKPGKLLMYGPAGSGKTAITLYCGKTLHDQGRSFKIIVYTNVLWQFIVAGAADLKLPPDSVTTLYRWARQLHSQQLGAPPGSGDEKYSLWVDRLIEHWRRNPGAIPRHQYILVDEAQDFKPNVATLLRMIAPNIVVAADPAQSLYEEIRDQAALQQRWAPFDIVHEIPSNYRNPKAIAALAAVFLDANSVSRANFLHRVKGRIGETQPIWYQVADPEERIERIKDIIAETRGSVRIGLLYPHRHNLDADRLALERRGVHLQVALSGRGDYNFRSTLPVLTTVHSSKGLEFDWVILPGLDEDKWDCDLQSVDNRHLFFVALTRAKEKLFLLSTQGRECRFMQEILTDHRHLIQTPTRPAETQAYRASTSAAISEDDDPF